MSTKRAYLLYFMIGVIVSLVSGLYTQDLTKGAGALVTGYGLPLPWLEKITIVSPGSPTNYSLRTLGLVVDTIFWSVLIGIAYTFYRKVTKT